MSSRIDNDNLLENYKTIWTNAEDLQNIKLYAFPVYGEKYIKNKVETCGDKVYTKFRG